MQTVHPDFVIPAMLIGTFDFYYFIPLSLTLTLYEGRKVSTKQNLFIGYIFSHTFHLIRLKFDVVMKQFKLNKRRLLFNKIY